MLEKQMSIVSRVLNETKCCLEFGDLERETKIPRDRLLVVLSVMYLERKVAVNAGMDRVTFEELDQACFAKPTDQVEEWMFSDA